MHQTGNRHPAVVLAGGGDCRSRERCRLLLGNEGETKTLGFGRDLFLSCRAQRPRRVMPSGTSRETFPMSPPFGMVTHPFLVGEGAALDGRCSGFFLSLCF